MAQLLDPDQWGKGGQSPSGSDERTEPRTPGPRRTGSSGAPTPAATRTRGAEHGWDPFADDPDAAADSPAPPRRTAPRASEPPRGPSRLPLILLVVLVVLALVAGGIWAAASGLLPIGGGAGGPAPETPAASAPATDAPQPSGSPSAPADPAATPLPASCEDLYSDGMTAAIESDGFVLNPAWSQEEGLRLPTNDPELSALLEPLPRLDCGWLPPGGGGSVGIITSVAQVTPEEQAAVEARFAALGWTQIEELGSVRYVFEETGDGNSLGQSHLLRDGLWFASGWINYGPTGYTADMVSQVFG